LVGYLKQFEIQSAIGQLSKELMKMNLLITAANEDLPLILLIGGIELII
jgi:hypothetical protein